MSGRHTQLEHLGFPSGCAARLRRGSPQACLAASEDAVHIIAIRCNEETFGFAAGPRARAGSSDSDSARAPAAKRRSAGELLKLCQ